MMQLKKLLERAMRVIPCGVNSPVRTFGAVGGRPPFIRSASGCRLTDVDGNEYIDYIGSWGAAIVGHAHPAVTEAVAAALRDGTSFGTPSPLEVGLAEEIVDRVPSVEQVRMVNSGTEAVMSAIRLARAATGRDKIVKFAGCYHGHADAVLVKAGSGVATLGLPDSPGVPAASVESTLVARFNDIDSVESIFDAHAMEIAAVIVEPVAGNMGVVPPASGFLKQLRDLTSRCGALLIFDEVMTGFRVARGGAQTLYGVTPDLTTFGKVIGGGLPVGAYGGASNLMQQIAPAGPVYQAGTLSGNPLAMAAGLATLQQLTDDAYQRLERQSADLADGLSTALNDAGVQAVVQRVGSMLTVFFGAEAVGEFDGAAAADHDRFARFFHALLSRGIHLPPSGYESWFVSLAHDANVIRATVDKARESVREI
ncbi:MAG: glutamate-1-semialdehyde 2,1-aminomutase [Planctomycetota bacterium]|nr:glutamate-1-semialdehyde 2,1-aminomutase [Planctomycetota bacterium]